MIQKLKKNNIVCKQKEAVAAVASTGPVEPYSTPDYDEQKEQCASQFENWTESVSVRFLVIFKLWYLCCKCPNI